MESFSRTPLTKRISASTWAGLGVIGTVAVLLWAEPMLERLWTALVGRPGRPEMEIAPELLAPDTQETAVHPDLYGDPLPPGAIARIGIVRLYQEGGVSCGCFLPGGRLLVTGGHDGTIIFWDTTTGKERRVLRAHKAAIRSLTVSPDGRIMASASFDRTGVRLWDVLSGKPLRVLTDTHIGPVGPRDFAPDGKTLVTSDGSGRLRQWVTATGKELPGYTHKMGFVRSLGYTPDGLMLFAQDNDRTVRLWDPSTNGDWQVSKLTWDVREVTVSPDGKVMAQEMNDRRIIRLVEIPSGKVTQLFLGEDQTIHNLVFSPDSRTLATGSIGRSPGQLMQIWDIATATKRLEAEATWPLAFSPDGKLLAGVSGGSIRFWHVDTDKEQVAVPRLQAITALCLSSDARMLTTASIEGSVRLWERASGKELRRATMSGRVIAFSPDGKVAAAIPERRDSHDADSSTVLNLCDVATGNLLHQLKHEHEIRGAAFSPDGKMLAVAEWSTPGMVYLWESATGKEIRRFEGQHIGTHMTDSLSTLPVVFSPDGKTLACGYADCTVRLWEAETGKLCRRLGQPLRDEQASRMPDASGITCLAFSADSKMLASGMLCPGSRLIQIWDLISGQELHRLTANERHPRWDGFKGWVRALTFSPDGKTLASCGYGVTAIRLWDMTTGKERQHLLGHRAMVLSLTFSKDGKILASGSLDGTALIWDLRALNFLFHMPF
jgi:WD40 repeat protein